MFLALAKAAARTVVFVHSFFGLFLSCGDMKCRSQLGYESLVRKRLALCCCEMSTTPSTPPRTRIGVYCSSRLGLDPTYAEVAEQVGYEIARRNMDLIYGGGQIGLMGVVADAAKAAGSHVIGVIPEALLEHEVAHQGLDELIVVADMPERKRIMYDEADIYLTLAGGVGTMEEMFEVLCWRYLGLHPRPIGLLNTLGYYDHLLAFIDHAMSEELASQRVRDHLIVATDPCDLLDRLEQVDQPASMFVDTPQQGNDSQGSLEGIEK